MQIYRDFEGFPPYSALFGLVHIMTQDGASRDATPW